MVEYLLPNLKVEGSRPFLLHRRKISVAQKTQQKIQAHMPKTFFALQYVRNESAAPGRVAENHVKP